MYSLDDTIIAVSSPSLVPGQIGRTILRLSGPQAFEIFNFQFSIFDCKGSRRGFSHEQGIYPFQITLPRNIRAEGMAYCFVAPKSYTGQDLVELHLSAARPVVEMICQSLLQAGMRQAGPGEFTLRAYLNGKLDLAQAEAVMHIISAGSESQIAAARQLLSGGLAGKSVRIRNELLELLSLLEAELDFTEEDVKFIQPAQAVEKIRAISRQIQDLLDSAVRCEELMDLPSVGLAGLPNAGKSSLMNILTTHRRSIVSDLQGTTRDVLTELLELPSGRCALFDCAGLGLETADTLNELARQAAFQSLRSASVVIFCVDLANDGNWTQALHSFKQLQPKTAIGVGTKQDLLDARQAGQKHRQLKKLFGMDFLLTSAETAAGMESLKTKLSEVLLSASTGKNEADPQIAINLRHRQKLESALKRLAEVAEEIVNEHPEVGAMLLRGVWRDIGGLEHEHVDERILDVIFSKFCIGK
ncbi:MAG: tRNA uridine-5-carboxymethylaminomethyl(34) synthesis GTPase MnmE [Planctomycetes bacterium]|nr:tRNA uridine-5-carboxymethylaminomethyl(34) synthesis GTPase MnmE [Planctomycetota bacterium]